MAEVEEAKNGGGEGAKQGHAYADTFTGSASAAAVVMFSLCSLNMFLIVSSTPPLGPG